MITTFVYFKNKTGKEISDGYTIIQSTVTSRQQRSDCPPFFVPVGSLCLSFMTWADQTWDEARQSCHGMGGELATITDIEDLRAIYLYLHQEGKGKNITSPEKYNWS